MKLEIEYNSPTSPRHYFLNNEYVCRSYMMTKYKNLEIKNSKDNKNGNSPFTI